MKKEICIALIQKDIQELDIIAKGLYETEKTSLTLLNLATKKAQDVLANLKNLAKIAEEVQKEVTEVREVTGVTEEIQEVQEILEAQPIQEVQEIREEIREIREEIQEEVQPIQEVREIQPIPEVQKPEVAVVQPEKRTTIADKMAVGFETKMDSITKSKEINSVANALSKQKVTELKKSISLGDRFRFQRELFAGNVDVMNQTLTELDSLDSYETALQLLEGKFRWNFEDEAASDFLNILNRRYL